MSSTLIHLFEIDLFSGCVSASVYVMLQNGLTFVAFRARKSKQTDCQRTKLGMLSRLTWPQEHSRDLNWGFETGIDFFQLTTHSCLTFLFHLFLCWQTSFIRLGIAYLYCWICSDIAFEKSNISYIIFCKLLYSSWWCSIVHGPLYNSGDLFGDLGVFWPFIVIETME